MTAVVCRTCPFWVIPPGASVIDLKAPAIGRCHYGPPGMTMVALPQSGGIAIQAFCDFPSVKANDWCSKHPNFVIKDKGNTS